MSPTLRCRRFSLTGLCLLFLSSFAFVNALKFDLTASPEGNRRCVSQWVDDEKLVIGTVLVGDADHQKVDVEVFDTTPHNNKYWHKLAMEGETKFAFTTHDEAEVQFCFTNTLDQGFQVGPDMKRHINLHIDTGAEAEDFSEEIKEKKLKPVEAEIRRLEALVNEVTNEMEHLKEREMALRDVNESTNDRVKWFNLFTMIAVIGTGVWQILYLRKYFRAKKII